MNHLLKKKLKKYNGNSFVASKSCEIIVIVFVPLLLSLLTNFMKDVYAYSIPSPSSCISYNPTIKLITIGCKSANLTHVYNQIHDPTILSKQEQKQSSSSSSSSFRTFPSSSSNNIWLLSANLTIAQGATLYINSTDTAWLKINANYAIFSHTSNNNNNNNNNNNSAAYGIQVFGNLKVDSVKITSWNPETNDYASVKTTTTTTTTKPVNGPFIIVQNGATGTTDITKSEIAYLKWLSYLGGNGSVLRGDNIHNLSFGFYSKGVSGMVFENNDVHDNGLYGIDPHTGTHDMIIRNNNVHNDGSIDIICSKFVHLIVTI